MTYIRAHMKIPIPLGTVQNGGRLAFIQKVDIQIQLNLNCSYTYKW